MFKTSCGALYDSGSSSYSLYQKYLPPTDSTNMVPSGIGSAKEVIWLPFSSIHSIQSIVFI